MSDEYLWDRSGPPDPEIERLERVLGTLRSTPPAPEWPALAPEVGRRPLSLRYLATAAALIGACSAGIWSIGPSTRVAWPVVRVAGTPTVNHAQVADAGRLAVGEWLETDTASRATVAIGDVGRLDVEPDSRLQLLSAATGNHRLAMAHGTVHAFIWAPPGQFFVETPSSTVVDLGMRVHVDRRSQWRWPCRGLGRVGRVREPRSHRPHSGWSGMCDASWLGPRDASLCGCAWRVAAGARSDRLRACVTRGTGARGRSHPAAHAPGGCPHVVAPADARERSRAGPRVRPTRAPGSTPASGDPRRHPCPQSHHARCVVGRAGARIEHVVERVDEARRPYGSRRGRRVSRVEESLTPRSRARPSW